MTALDVIDRLTELGCAVRVEGERLKVRGPNLPEVAGLVSELRTQRDEALAILKEAGGNAPSLAEVKAALPHRVRLVSYNPKETPFAVAPVSVVTNAGRFFRAYLSDLRARLENPEGYYCPPLTEILAKLADAGLELALRAE